MFRYNAAITFRCVLLVIAILWTFPTYAETKLSCNSALFATSFDGNVTFGSKAILIDYVNRGEDIRLGWELDFDRDGPADLTHWADASFLSIRQGEVFAQAEAMSEALKVLL